MGLFKRVVKGILGFVAGLMLLLALAVGSGIFLNQRAERHAAAFCDGVAISSPVAEAVTRAKSMGIRLYHSDDMPGEVFLFPGWLFNMAECRVETLDGRITKKWTVEARD